MAKRIAAIIFHAPLGDSAAERVVEAGRRAAAADLLATLRSGGISRVLAVAASEDARRQLEEAGATLAQPVPEESFHFGRVLRRIVREERLEGLLYFGSGSGGLLSASQIARLAWFVQSRKIGALFNNFYSCDFAAIAGAKRLIGIELPQIDNPLGFSLSDAGFPCHALPRDAASQFDIDTPTDLLLLALAGHGGPCLRRFVESRHVSHPFAEQVLHLLAKRSAHVMLVGRVNPRTWVDFEKAVACRTSGMVEGRGMRSAACTIDPFIRQTMASCRPDEFFRRLAGAADAAIIDTRPLLAVRGALPAPAIRFSSDLLQPDHAEDPAWKQFTQAALSSPIPVILGGHSLVSGGLYLLAEACWKGKELPRRLHPDLFDWEKEPT